jgi:hypothetical protein
MDFYDSSYGIAIEFVSTEDVTAWNKGEQTVSAGEYDTLNAAEQLSEALEEAYCGGNYTAAVLYDPCAISDESDAKPISVEQLKAQADDFFKWLKTQGII